MIQNKTSQVWLRRSHAIFLLCLTHSTVHGFAPLSARPSTTFRLHVRPTLVCRQATSFTHAPPFSQGLATKATIGLTQLPLLATALPSTQSLAALWYLTILAISFGAQPFFVKKYIPKTICRSTVLLAQEVTKFVAAAGLLWVSGGWTMALAGWSVQGWALAAGIPAAIYVVQNYCTLMAYQNLSPITFNVLNQTKTLSAALCTYLIMKRRQSKLQIVSLLVLLLSALVIENVVPITTRERGSRDIIVKKPEDSDNNRQTYIVTGVLPVLVASFLSGLAGALSEQTVQRTGRNAFLFTMELSVASVIFWITSLLLLHSPDSKRISEHGFFSGWTSTTWIPICTKAFGGIVVGLVTKHAGAVRKGFALIFGLLLSGILQKMSKDEDVTAEQVVGGILAAVSLWMHSSFPHVDVNS